MGKKTYSHDEIMYTLTTRYVAQRAGLSEFQGGRESLPGVQEEPRGAGELVGREHGRGSHSTSKGLDVGISQGIQGTGLDGAELWGAEVCEWTGLMVEGLESPQKVRLWQASSWAVVISHKEWEAQSPKMEFKSRGRQ